MIRAGSSVTEQELRSCAGQRLPKFRMSKKIVILALPSKSTVKKATHNEKSWLANFYVKKHRNLGWALISDLMLSRTLGASPLTYTLPAIEVTCSV